ncbi:MAG: ATP-grasp domain-containing protein [Planctomycetota bacterium]|jgi:glutathione synthase/RimK-type ligase-like ATP-grasp enzyme
MIYLHLDRKYRPDQWYKRFALLLDKRGIPYKKVDLLRKSFRKLRPKEGDALIGRFGHNADDRRRIEPNYEAIAEAFGRRVFPKPSTYYYYDRKDRQLELCLKEKYPIPRSAFVRSPEEMERFLDTKDVHFPLVSKRVHGASSSEVRLARQASEVFLPGVVQEFCEGNDGDVRIVVIGDRVMGFRRRNRPGDFRASGSGLLEYPNDLDPECVQIAYDISRQNGFDSMAYDFVRDGRGQWVVLEFSYCYMDTAVRDCRYYYAMPGGRKRDKTGAYPQDYILEDFLAAHCEAAAPAVREWRFPFRVPWRRSRKPAA